MIRKTLLLAGALGAIAGAASAQDLPMTPMQPAPSTTPQTPSSPQAADFIPGAAVVGSDGAQLGVIDSIRMGASGDQMLHVRAEDGTVKAVPSAGATVRDGTVAVAWTEAEFEAAIAAPDPVDEAAPMQPPAMTRPNTMPTSPMPEDKPDAANPPVDPPAQPRR